MAPGAVIIVGGQKHIAEPSAQRAAVTISSQFLEPFLPVANVTDFYIISERWAKSVAGMAGPPL